MLISTKSEDDYKFEPIELNIKIESKEELALVLSLFNVSSSKCYENSPSYCKKHLDAYTHPNGVTVISQKLNNLIYALYSNLATYEDRLKK